MGSKHHRERVQRVDALLEGLRRLPRQRRTLFVGIDGLGGSGKSTLAKALRGRAPELVSVVEMDNFYRVAAERRRGESTSYGGAFDWERLLQQVLQPLLADVPRSYRRYDWDRDTLADWCHVPVGGIVVVEGVSSTRLELAKYYDFRIWIQTPREVRLARGIDRDGEEARDRWITEWMPEEDRYVELDQPHQRADVVVNGASRLVRDPWVEFACLAGS